MIVYNTAMNMGVQIPFQDAEFGGKYPEVRWLDHMIGVFLIF